ncbi:MAG: exopolysaccharide transport family protein [Azospirillaceae bacterium]
MPDEAAGRLSGSPTGAYRETAFDAGPSSAPEIDISTLFVALWRARYVLALLVAAIGGLAAYYAIGLPDRYQANGVLLLEGGGSDVLGGGPLDSGRPLDRTVYESRVEAMRSRTTVEGAVRALDLATHPEFAEMLAEDETGTDPMVLLVGAFYQHYTVEPVGNSSAVTASFEAEDPTLAAAAVNTAFQVFLENQFSSELEFIRTAQRELQNQLEATRTEIADKQQEMVDFQTETGLVRGENANIYEEQITRLTDRMIVARADLNEAIAKREQMERARDSGRLGTVPEVINSPFIQNLQEGVATLRQQRATALAEYGERHAAVQNANSAIAELQGDLNVATSNVANSLVTQEEQRRAVVQSLEGELADLSERAIMARRQEIELARLDAELTASRNAYQRLLDRSTELRIQENLEQPNARVLSPAEVPTQASFPDRKLIVIAGVMLAGMLGAGAVTLREVLGGPIRSPSQAQAIGSLPTVASLKRPRRLLGMGKDMAREVVERPRSRRAQALQGLLGRLLRGAGHGQGACTVMITDCKAERGSPDVALALARTSAQAGHRTLLISLVDSRVIARETGDAGRGGLAAVVDGASALESALITDKKTSLHVLPAGKRAGNADPAATARALQFALTRFASMFDVVIVIAPPVTEAAETSAAVPHVDTVLLRVDRHRTSRDALRGAQETIAAMAPADARLLMVSP